MDRMPSMAFFDWTVVVLDITMPILNGIQASLRIHESHPRSKVLFLTTHENDEYVSAAIFCRRSWVC